MHGVALFDVGKVVGVVHGEAGSIEDGQVGHSREVVEVLVLIHVRNIEADLFRQLINVNAIFEDRRVWGRSPLRNKVSEFIGIVDEKFRRSHLVVMFRVLENFIAGLLDLVHEWFLVSKFNFELLQDVIAGS